ncbi:MAG TPA: LuxR C-terminal-related transcriptional regulator, partial [Anaerolinea sp.]|nr:LuxR C-terminal-related transcriptional regulator [Anaerolinea sp.]
NLDAPAVQALNHKTEGWIAGLQMAALAMRDSDVQGLPGASGQPSAADFVASFSGSNRFILDYLIEEVLNRQPEAVQRFLVQTSILEQLCAPLCNALLEEDPPNAQATLQHLERSNLFVVALDQQRYWYRYHHLFADLLRKRLAQSAPERVAELHRRAIRWYEQNGLVPSAIQHAFQLKDYAKAAALVAQVTEGMWGRGEFATLLAWMEALPEDARQPYPSLLTFQVSMLISLGRLKEAEACIPILERHIQATAQEDPGNAAALHTYIASFRTDWPGVVDHARAALQHLTREEDAGQRCGVSLILGNACLMQGLLEEAGDAFGEAILAAETARKPHMALTGLANLALLRWQQGSLRRAEQVCRAGLRLMEESGPNRSPMAVDVWLAWGGVLCEQGNLAEAEPLLNRALELADERRMVWQVALGRQARARLLWAEGQAADAESAARAAVDWAAAHPVPAHIVARGAALLAEIWLRQGKNDEARNFFRARRLEAGDEILFPRQWEALALARWMWQSGEEGAEGLVERIAGWAETKRHTGAWTSAHILHALIWDSRGDREQALLALGRALELAESEGCIQAFVDEGDAMRGLLRAALERGIQPGFSARVLAAFPGEPAEGPPAVTAKPAPLSAGSIPLAEPLSRRENEILQLIAAGLSNKEIAQKLFISLRTVKYYSTGLYNKLGVDSRMQAVIRAREVGLL